MLFSFLVESNYGNFSVVYAPLCVLFRGHEEKLTFLQDMIYDIVFGV